MHKSTFVLSQILGRAIVALVQALTLLAVAALAFALPLNLLTALLTVAVTILGLLVFLGIGFALACVIRTESLIYDAISAIAWPVVLLSELFFPASELPWFLPSLAGGLPSTQMVRLLRSLVLYQDTRWGSVAPGLASLVLWTCCSFAIGRLAFRWSD